MRRVILRIIFLITILMLISSFKINSIANTMEFEIKDDITIGAESSIAIEETVEINIIKIMDIAVHGGALETYFIKTRDTYKNFTWTSSDTSVLEITVEQWVQGVKKTNIFNERQKFDELASKFPIMEIVKMTGKKGGKATITATFDDYSTGKAVRRSLTQEVTVSGLDLSRGGSIPSGDARAEDIYEFIINNLARSENDESKIVDEKRLGQWIETLEENEKADTAYKPVIKKLKKLKNAAANGTRFETDYTEENKEIAKAYMKYYNVEISEDIKIILGIARDEGDFVGVLDNVNNYIPSDNISSADAKKMEKKISNILSVITSIGMILSVIMSAILGIKYMLGSVEEKADYKKGMIPYLVGAFLLFGICTIVKVLQQIGQSINNI